MKFAAIAALVASAAAYTPTVEQIMTEMEDDKKKTVKQEVNEMLGKGDNQKFINEKICTKVSDDDEEDEKKWTDLKSCLTNRDTAHVLAGVELVKKVENADCKTAYDKDTKKKVDATNVQAFFDCTAAAKERTEENPAWKKLALAHIYPKGGEELAKQGEKFCKATFDKAAKDKTDASYAELESCYEGVFNGGSAGIVIVVILAVACMLGGAVYCYRKSKGSDEENANEGGEKVMDNKKPHKVAFI